MSQSSLPVVTLDDLLAYQRQQKDKTTPRDRRRLLVHRPDREKNVVLAMLLTHTAARSRVENGRMRRRLDVHVADALLCSQSDPMLRSTSTSVGLGQFGEI